MSSSPEGELLRLVVDAVRRDEGVRAANALHGAVTEVWFDTLTTKTEFPVLTGWQVLAFADGSHLSDAAFGVRRVTLADWWEPVYAAARRLIEARPVRLTEAVVVRTGAAGPAGVAVVSADEFPVDEEGRFKAPIHPTGPITGRLREIVVELEELQAGLGPGSCPYFDVGDAVVAVEKLIEGGEPATAPPGAGSQPRPAPSG